uniref:Uncharacterized protein n=1 Tax=Pseudomonas phage HRDY3 TaxID=3236930 RepID=A0AB39CEP8_9VIRU
MPVAEKGFITTLEPMRLRMLRRRYGEMEFSEVVELAEQAENFLEPMTVFDPAWKKFTQDRRTWWEYAWLLSCEADRFCPSDPHVKYRGFLIGYPAKQPHVDGQTFREWLNQRPEDVTEEWQAWLPVYLRPDEVCAYAAKIYHKQRGVDGHLRNFEIMEIPVED